MTMKAQPRGAKQLAAFMPDIIEKALIDRGISEAVLISDWAAIVGERVAGYARPIQLQWPPRAPRRSPDTPTAGATLVLRVEGAFALEAQHCAANIIARINGRLGWRCIERIAFRQGPLPAPAMKRAGPPPPTLEAEAEARRAAEAVVDADLRTALARLGARAIDRSAAQTRGLAWEG
ncbi:MAG TPA: DciA family protein [Roseiarcus sp.]|nr:DciA family protein [Roseiarcus sp.]